MLWVVLYEDIYVTRTKLNVVNDSSYFLLQFSDFVTQQTITVMFIVGMNLYCCKLYND